MCVCVHSQSVWTTEMLQRHHQTNRLLERLCIYCQEVEMAWPYHKSQQYFHYHPTRYHLRQKKKQTGEKNGLTMSLNELGNPTHTLKDWHATKAYRGRWSGVQLCSDLTTTPNHGLMMMMMMLVFRDLISKLTMSSSVTYLYLFVIQLGQA